MPLQGESLTLDQTKITASWLSPEPAPEILLPEVEDKLPHPCTET